MVRKRKRNTNGNYPGTGAFLGSLVGGLPGALVSALGSPSAGGVVAEVGWIIGGGIGGHIGAKSDRKRRGAIGGAIGGIFTPLGAALGGYIGGRKPDSKKRNPAKKWILPGAVAASLVVGGGIGLAAGKKMKKRRGLQPANVPDRYEQVLCSPYGGHQICVYSYWIGGEPGLFYDAAVDGGAVLELETRTAEGAANEARQIIDSLAG